MPNWSVFNLGERGVQLTKSPLHIEGGELESAQNAILDVDQREGSLRKRPGWVSRVSGLAGSVRGVVNVPLSDPDALTNTFWAAIDAATGDTWRTSTNGTTWSGSTAIARAQRISKHTWTTVDLERFALHCVDTSDQLIYYPSDGYTVGTDQPILRATDGTFDSNIFTVPVTLAGNADRAITALRFFDPYIYFAVWTVNGANSQWRTFQLSTKTGAITSVGPVVSMTGQVAISDFANFNGRIYAMTARTGGSQAVQSIRPPDGDIPGETAWTTEFTPTDRVPLSATIFRGNLYVGTSNSAGPGTFTPAVLQITASGTVTASDTGATGVLVSAYGGLVVYSDRLYAARRNPNTSELVIRQFDGTTWVTDQNVITLAANAEFIGQSLVVGANLYMTFPSTTAANGYILRRSGGTWTSVDSSIAHRGFLAFLQT